MRGEGEQQTGGSDESPPRRPQPPVGCGHAAKPKPSLGQGSECAP